MLKNLKSFVSETFCLQCEGCCRFDQKDSVWRPRISDSEKETFASAMDENGFLMTNKSDDHYICQFFDPASHRCHIYQTRPFECRLYPFMITKSSDFLHLLAHRHCAFILQTEKTDEFVSYIEYLRELFSQQAVRRWLAQYQPYALDYSRFHEEFAYLFQLT